MSRSWKIIIRNAIIIACITLFSTLTTRGGVISPEDVLAALISSGLVFFIELANSFGIDYNINKKGGYQGFFF